MQDYIDFVFRCSVFAQAPEARSLFKRVHGDDTTSGAFQAHSMRVLAGFDIVINLLDQPDALKAELSHLEAQHDKRGIPDEYFTVSNSVFFLVRTTDFLRVKHLTDVSARAAEFQF